MKRNKKDLTKKQQAFYDDILLYIGWLDIHDYQKLNLIEKIDDFIDTIL